VSKAVFQNGNPSEDTPNIDPIVYFLRPRPTTTVYSHASAYWLCTNWRRKSLRSCC